MFASEKDRDACSSKPRHVEIASKEREEGVFKSFDIKSCKHVLGSGTGIGVT